MRFSNEELLFLTASFSSLRVSFSALTSSISMLEVPVAYVVESKGFSRTKAVWGLTTVIFSVSTVIAFNFGELVASVNFVDNYFVQLAAGMNFKVSDAVTIGTEVRYNMYDADLARDNDFEFGVRTQIKLKKKKKKNEKKKK